MHKLYSHNINNDSFIANYNLLNIILVSGLYKIEMCINFENSRQCKIINVQDYKCKIINVQDYECKKL